MGIKVLVIKEKHSKVLKAGLMTSLEVYSITAFYNTK
jgi:hypothetical protein